MPLSSSPAEDDASEETSLCNGYRVLVRVRPLIRFIERENDPVAVEALSTTRLRVHRPEQDALELKFDRAFGPEAGQAEMFKALRDLVQSAIQGQYGTILAYGQTGSGKTYTMTGEAAAMAHHGGTQDEVRMSLNDSQRGVIPRALEFLFRRTTSQEDATKWHIFCSFMEIYNERVYDLLKLDKVSVAPSAKPTSTGSWRGSVPQPDPVVKQKRAAATRGEGLEVLEGRDGSVSVPGLTVVQVRSLEQAMEILRIGTTKRTMGDNGVNPTSSRSHAVFQVLLEKLSSTSGSDGIIQSSKLNLVDLAGSEKLRPNAKVSPAILQELTAINTSLSALGQCISALISTKRTHVPTRDSKLTRLLQESFKGRSLTAMCVCVSPTTSAIEETLSSLKFADRAKRAVLDRRPPTAATVKGNRQVEELLQRMQELSQELEDEREARRRLEEQVVLQHQNTERALAARLRPGASDPGDDSAPYSAPPSEAPSDEPFKQARLVPGYEDLSPKKLMQQKLSLLSEGRFSPQRDDGDRGGSPSFGDEGTPRLGLPQVPVSEQMPGFEEAACTDAARISVGGFGAAVTAADAGGTGTGAPGNIEHYLVQCMQQLTQQNQALVSRMEALEVRSVTPASAASPAVATAPAAPTAAGLKPRLAPEATSPVTLEALRHLGCAPTVTTPSSTTSPSPRSGCRRQAEVTPSEPDFSEDDLGERPRSWDTRKACWPEEEREEALGRPQLPSCSTLLHSAAAEGARESDDDGASDRGLSSSMAPQSGLRSRAAVASSVVGNSRTKLNPPARSPGRLEHTGVVAAAVAAGAPAVGRLLGQVAAVAHVGEAAATAAVSARTQPESQKRAVEAGSRDGSIDASATSTAGLSPVPQRRGGGGTPTASFGESLSSNRSTGRFSMAEDEDACAPVLFGSGSEPEVLQSPAEDAAPSSLKASSSSKKPSLRPASSTGFAARAPNASPLGAAILAAMGEPKAPVKESIDQQRGQSLITTAPASAAASTTASSTSSRAGAGARAESPRALQESRPAQGLGRRASTSEYYYIGSDIEGSGASACASSASLSTLASQQHQPLTPPLPQQRGSSLLQQERRRLAAGTGGAGSANSTGSDCGGGQGCDLGNVRSGAPQPDGRARSPKSGASRGPAPSLAALRSEMKGKQDDLRRDAKERRHSVGSAAPSQAVAVSGCTTPPLPKPSPRAVGTGAAMQPAASATVPPRQKSAHTASSAMDIAARCWQEFEGVLHGT